VGFKPRPPIRLPFELAKYPSGVCLELIEKGTVCRLAFSKNIDNLAKIAKEFGRDRTNRQSKPR
jgi:hypothetical protein